jgi:hypothetical protein
MQGAAVDLKHKTALRNDPGWCRQAVVRRWLGTPRGAVFDLIVKERARRRVCAPARGVDRNTVSAATDDQRLAQWLIYARKGCYQGECA